MIINFFIIAKAVTSSITTTTKTATQVREETKVQAHIGIFSIQNSSRQKQQAKTNQMSGIDFLNLPSTMLDKKL